MTLKTNQASQLWYNFESELSETINLISWPCVRKLEGGGGGRSTLDHMLVFYILQTYFILSITCINVSFDQGAYA